MALQTDLNVAPYYDDYDPTKNFYRILFQPGVAVQARELNQLQTILQSQVEKFGDNIFKRGTIIEGCNIVLHSNLPYVKIKDSEIDGTPVNISSYDNLFVKNAANVSGYIVQTTPGFETQSPNLNTLFVKYNSSGNDSNTHTFSADNPLTVFSPSYPIFKVNIVNGSSGFSNSDTVVVLSSLAVQNTTGGNTFAGGSFNVNDVIRNGVANATIVAIDTTSNTQALILKIKPLAADLLTANNIKWRFSSGETITNFTTSAVALLANTIGTGATGSLVTDSSGKIDSITVTNMGQDYYVAPYITVSITSGSSITESQITTANLVAQNYLTTVAVAAVATDPIGTGYGVSVDSGTIYQKGFFSRVDNQLIVVNKYSNTGFTKSVGFNTTELIINSNQDTTLLDNATGTYNYTAPGADRLKLTPVLSVVDTSTVEANAEFLPIVQFADGAPYKQNIQTVYNFIGDELAKRTFEESGNYVLDQFNLTTKDSTVITETPSVFKIYIDPGTAYIKGYRVQTVTNYTANVAKGTDNVLNPAATIRVGYGSFVRVNQLGGIFEFNIGASVELYDTAKTYITSAAGATITAAGTKIGVARIRSLMLESGTPGTAGAVYRLYLFDIIMDNGKNFSSIRSIYYSNSVKAIADIVLDNSIAVLNDSKNSSMIFKIANAMKSADTLTYDYRTIKATQAATNGVISFTVGTGETLPYTSGVLSDTEKNEIFIIPTTDYQANVWATGTVTTTATSNAVSGAGGINFTTAFKAGDFIKIGNNSVNNIKQISQITSATALTLTSNADNSFAANTVVLYFPKNIPIPMTNRTARTANVVTNNTLNLNLGVGLANTSNNSSTANVQIIYNVTSNNITSGAKSTNRQILTRVKIANNAGGLNGPWALGVSDAFRMRNIYQANGAQQVLSVNINTGIQGSGTSAAFVKITNCNFANGDSVVYSNTGGTTVIGGLTNSTTYYAVYANASGFALSATRGGANITMTASGTSEVHTFTGSPLYFAATTYGVSDVTNDFYIDNNQKEDYLDTSYLYRKPRKTDISTNDVFLVKYDAFTSSGRIKTVSSYPIQDSVNLTSLTAGSYVHTMEIPEMVGTSGQYYDLRDEFDFRPSSANTIPYATDAGNTAIINPVEPSIANRFGAGEKYFPVPNSKMTANISYYVGRNDRVVLDDRGQFIVVKGTAGSLEAFPAEPKDSMTIQYLRIPPYPSLPASVSSDLAAIIDTKVANEKYGLRKDNFKVTTPIDKNQQARIQIKNYQMNDIASLEKRLTDLEYYVSFTLAEAIAHSKFIPSSLNNALDRFKFGFFVDPFTDYTYSDTENPDFYATIQDDRLSPKLNSFNIEMQSDDDARKTLLLPYEEYTLINQREATYGMIQTITTNTAVTNTAVTNTAVTVVPPTITQRTTSVIERNKSFSNSDAGTAYEDYYYNFSSIAGPVELYIIGRDNWFIVDVSQSTTSGGIYTTTLNSSSAVALGGITGGDGKNAFTASKGLNDIIPPSDGGVIESAGSVNTTGTAVAGVYFIEDSFALKWNHNPALGQYVRIRVIKGGRHGASTGKAGAYAYKLFYPTDTVESNTSVSSTVSNFQYVGMVSSIAPSSFSLLPPVASRVGPYIADAQKFTITATGLKPNTYHKFIFDNSDNTIKCSQVRTGAFINLPATLITDATGAITFDFYYDAGITEATSDWTQINKLAASVAGVKSFSIESFETSSKAIGTIEIKSYVNNNAAATSTAQLNVTGSGTVTQTSVNAYDYSLGTIPDLTSTASTANNTYAVNFDGTGYLSGGKNNIFQINK
jgi:hypothetical protein